MTSHPHFHLGSNWRGQRGQVKVLRAVATFELSKGMVVLLAGCSLLLLLHRDTSEVAESLLRVLHISPDHHLARIFLDWADRITDEKLWITFGIAIAYSILRFVEAYGLWRARPWAEWMALVSGTFYIPFEVHELIRRLTVFHISLLAVNLGVVWYMIYLRLLDQRNSMPKSPDETSDPE